MRYGTVNQKLVRNNERVAITDWWKVFPSFYCKRQP